MFYFNSKMCPNLTFFFIELQLIKGFSGGSDGKESAYNAEDLGFIPRSGRSPEEEMATHSNMLAQRIPRTDEPGGLQ